MTNIKNVNFEKFADEYGNLLKEFEVIKYFKCADGQWKEAERYGSDRDTYEVDGQLYFRSDDTLIMLNMDFDSKTCGACYQIGNLIKNNKKITGNEILFTCKIVSNYTLSFHKQSYSDGTCFYTLQDEKGDWNVGYGSDNISNLIARMQREITIYKIPETKYKKYPQEARNILNSYANMRKEVLNNLLEIE